MADFYKLDPKLQSKEEGLKRYLQEQSEVSELTKKEYDATSSRFFTSPFKIAEKAETDLEKLRRINELKDPLKQRNKAFELIKRINISPNDEQEAIRLLEADRLLEPFIERAGEFTSKFSKTNFLTPQSFITAFKDFIRVSSKDYENIIEAIVKLYKDIEKTSTVNAKELRIFISKNIDVLIERLGLTDTDIKELMTNLSTLGVRVDSIRQIGLTNLEEMKSSISDLKNKLKGQEEEFKRFIAEKSFRSLELVLKALMIVNEKLGSLLSYAIDNEDTVNLIIPSVLNQINRNFGAFSSELKEAFSGTDATATDIKNMIKDLKDEFKTDKAEIKRIMDKITKTTGENTITIVNSIFGAAGAIKDAIDKQDFTKLQTEIEDVKNILGINKAEFDSIMAPILAGDKDIIKTLSDLGSKVESLESKVESVSTRDITEGLPKTAIEAIKKESEFIPRVKELEKIITLDPIKLDKNFMITYSNEEKKNPSIGDTFTLLNDKNIPVTYKITGVNPDTGELLVAAATIGGTGLDASRNIKLRYYLTIAFGIKVGFYVKWNPAELNLPTEISRVMKAIFPANSDDLTPKKIKALMETKKPDFSSSESILSSEIESIPKGKVSSALSKFSGSGSGLSYKPGGIIKINGVRVIKAGKYYVSPASLDKGVLLVKMRSGRKVAGFPKILLTNDQIYFIKNLLLNGVIDMQTYDEMDAEEKNVIDSFITFCKITDPITGELIMGQFIPEKNKTPTKKNLDQMVKRYNLLKGELMAGNNSDEIVNELKIIIDRLYDNGYIATKDYKKLVSILSS